MERGLEGVEICHVLKALLYLFEAGEMLMEREHKAGRVMVKAFGNEVLIGAHGVDMLIELHGQDKWRFCFQLRSGNY